METNSETCDPGHLVPRGLAAHHQGPNQGLEARKLVKVSQFSESQVGGHIAVSQGGGQTTAEGQDGGHTAEGPDGGENSVGQDGGKSTADQEIANVFM